MSNNSHPSLVWKTKPQLIKSSSSTILYQQKDATQSKRQRSFSESQAEVHPAEGRQRSGSVQVETPLNAESPKSSPQSPAFSFTGFSFLDRKANSFYIGYDD